MLVTCVRNSRPISHGTLSPAQTGTGRSRVKFRDPSPSLWSPYPQTRTGINTHEHHYALVGALSMRPLVPPLLRLSPIFTSCMSSPFTIRPVVHLLSFYCMSLRSTCVPSLSHTGTTMVCSQRSTERLQCIRNNVATERAWSCTVWE